jgi:hypothetical protein
LIRRKRSINDGYIPCLLVYGSQPARILCKSAFLKLTALLEYLMPNELRPLPGTGSRFCRILSVAIHLLFGLYDTEKRSNFYAPNMLDSGNTNRKPCITG